MTNKENQKQEKILLKLNIKKHICAYESKISAINFDSFDLSEYKYLPLSFIISEQKKAAEKHYNNEFKKLCTKLKQSAIKCGRKAFEYQLEFVEKSNTKLFDGRFTRSEIAGAYRTVIKELYFEK